MITHVRYCQYGKYHGMEKAERTGTMLDFADGFKESVVECPTPDEHNGSAVWIGPGDWLTLGGPPGEPMPPRPVAKLQGGEAHQ